MSTDNYRLTKAQAVAGFLAEERAEEIDIITAAMTKEQHHAALEAAGMSREAQTAYFAKQQQKLRAIIDKQAAPENVVPIQKPAPAKRRFHFTRRDAGMGALASLVTAAAFVIRGAMVVAPAMAPVVSMAASIPPPALEVTIRQEAYAACDTGNYQECLDKLDQAKAIDPWGDVQIKVENARIVANAHLKR